MNSNQIRYGELLSGIGSIATLIGFFLGDSAWKWGFMAATILLGALFLFLQRMKDQLALRVCGAHRYIRSYQPEMNAYAFANATEEFRYFGISFESVKPSFMAWHDKHKLGAGKIRLLLLNPDNTSLIRDQALFERALFGMTLTKEQEAEISGIVDRTQSSIISTLRSLAALPGASTLIQLKFHNSHVREWTYEIDRKFIYLGMLQCGKSGFGGPVLVLKKRTNGEWSMFDYYHDGWKALWERSGGLVDFASYGKAAVAGGETK